MMPIFDSNLMITLVLGGVILAVAVILFFRHGKAAAEKRNKTKLGLVKIAGSGLKFDEPASAAAVSAPAVEPDSVPVPPKPDPDPEAFFEGEDEINETIAVPRSMINDGGGEADESGNDNTAETPDDVPADMLTDELAGVSANDEPIHESAGDELTDASEDDAFPDEPSDTPAPEPPFRRRIPETVKLKDRKVLAVEDVTISRERISTHFEGSGVKFEFAENGAQACEMFEKNPKAYSLILMDIQMPVMDGYEAARRMRSIDADWAKQIPIIAITANVLKEDIDQCFDAGMDDHIAKPVNMDDLQNKVFDFIMQGSE